MTLMNTLAFLINIISTMTGVIPKSAT